MRNSFLVGVQDKRIRIMNHRALEPLTLAEARELALWLVVLSETLDPGEELKPGELDEWFLATVKSMRAK